MQLANEQGRLAVSRVDALQSDPCKVILLTSLLKSLTPLLNWKCWRKHSFNFKGSQEEAEVSGHKVQVFPVPSLDAGFFLMLPDQLVMGPWDLGVTG